VNYKERIMTKEKALKKIDELKKYIEYMEISTYDGFIKKNRYIGFEDCNYGSRYMVVNGGSARGYICDPTGSWCSKDDSENEYKNKRDQFHVFSTKTQLLQWMINE
jgi:hypothetical protein